MEIEIIRIKNQNQKYLRFSEACAVYQKKHMVTMDPGKWDQVVKQAGFPYSGENFFSAVKEALENEGI